MNFARRFPLRTLSVGIAVVGFIGAGLLFLFYGYIPGLAHAPSHHFIAHIEILDIKRPLGEMPIITYRITGKPPAAGLTANLDLVRADAVSFDILASGTMNKAEVVNLNTARQYQAVGTTTESVPVRLPAGHYALRLVYGDGKSLANAVVAGVSVEFLVP